MFRTWCIKNDIFKKKACGITHVLMDGGVLYVTDDMVESFYRKYIEYVETEKIYVVEQKTINFNFFVDIDYQSHDALDFNQCMNISKVICGKVKKFSSCDAIISVAKPKKKGDTIKSGIHINWEGFVVDKMMANKMMYHIIESLDNIYPIHDWSKIVDSSVYGDPNTDSKGSGFRIPWSHKKSKHYDCGGSGCKECNETGKVVEVAYLPLWIYENGVICEIDQNPTYDRLKMTLVRTSNPHCEDNIPDIDITPLVKARKPKEGGFSPRQIKDEVSNPVMTSHIQRFINKNLTGQSFSVINKIYKIDKGTYYVQTNSKYCENLGREHGSNHIYFVISKKKIVQKCFCKCDTMKGRKFSFCKNFSGRAHNLTPTILQLL